MKLEKKTEKKASSESITIIRFTHHLCAALGQKTCNKSRLPFQRKWQTLFVHCFYDNKTFGYARVSTSDQNPASQEDALKQAGADVLFVDFFTGTRTSRPELDALLAQLRAGDTLMITRLDRLGRSTKDLLNLVTGLEGLAVALVVLEQKIDTSTAEGRLFFTMVAAFAEFEREIMRARTMDGLAAARARGRIGGRKPALSESQANLARKLVGEGHPISQVAQDLGVSRPTIYRVLT